MPSTKMVSAVYLDAVLDAMRPSNPIEGSTEALKRTDESLALFSASRHLRGMAIAAFQILTAQPPEELELTIAAIITTTVLKGIEIGKRLALDELLAQSHGKEVGA